MSGTTGQPSKGKWLEAGQWVVLLLVCALTLSKNQPDPDFWGHVQYGRDALAGGLPETTTYSYTADGHRWINHENLSELLLAAGVDTIGPAGLLALKCLLGVAVIGWIMRRASRRGCEKMGLAPSKSALSSEFSRACEVPVPILSQPRSGASPFSICFVALLVAINLMHFWVLRPQLFSYALFLALVWLLTWCFDGWPGHWRLPFFRATKESRGHQDREPAIFHCPHRRLKWLWLCPVIFAVWANTHGGFLAGYGIMTVYLFCRGIEAALSEGRAAFKLVAHLAAVVAATGAATLLNPYGLELHAWFLRSLATPRPEIIEWRPPEVLHVAWTPWWLLAAVAVGVLGVTRRPRDVTHVVLLVLTLWQAVEHRRHIPFFVILFGLWLPEHIEGVVSRLRGRGPLVSFGAGLSPRARRFAGATVAVACLLMAALLCPQIAVMPVMRSVYPVSAFEYIAGQNLHGKLVLRFMWAQYAIAAFGTQSAGGAGLQVAFDGRFRTGYPQEIIDMYFDFALGDHPTEPRYRSPNSPPIDGDRILDYRQPDLALVDRNQPHAVKVISRHRGTWVLLYQDKLAQLWGRAAKYDDPASPDYIPAEKRQITENEQSGFAAWPAIPARNGAQVMLANK